MLLHLDFSGRNVTERIYLAFNSGHSALLLSGLQWPSLFCCNKVVVVPVCGNVFVGIRK